MQMTPISNTREQIMDKATELLMQRGFNGFSYRDISTHLGIKNAAVHYHFPSKTDLALALVAEYQQTLRSSTSSFMAYGGPATPQLEGLFLFTCSQFSTGRSICPMGAFSVDFDDLPQEVKLATERFMRDSIKWLTQVLEAGREQSEFVFEGESKQRAIGILATLQGARQMARVGNTEILDGVIDQIRNEIIVSDQKLGPVQEIGLA
jgi:TetR/AcrR family transcriptional repressor of nem operon